MTRKEAFFKAGAAIFGEEEFNEREFKMSTKMPLPQDHAEEISPGMEEVVIEAFKTLMTSRILMQQADPEAFEKRTLAIMKAFQQAN